MNARMLLVPDSTARLVLEELDATASLTQSQLITRTGRTKGSVCKTLQFLVSEGYVRFLTGERASRLGRLDARHVQEYSRTGKTGPWETERDPGASTTRELCAVMDALVRGSLMTQREHA